MKSLLLKRAKRNPKYRKRLIAKLQKKAMELTPMEEMARVRNAFIRSTMEFSEDFLKKAGRTAEKFVTSHFMSLIVDKDGKNPFSITFTWRFPEKWELGIQVLKKENGYRPGNSDKFNFGIQCAHITASEAANEILREIFSRI